MRQIRHRSLSGAVLLLGMLLTPVLLPIASANASQQAQRSLALEIAHQGQHASSAQAGQTDPSGAEDDVDAPIADPSGAPALDLSWQAPETHAGSPAILTVRAVDAEGARDKGRSGNVALLTRTAI